MWNKSEGIETFVSFKYSYVNHWVITDDERLTVDNHRETNVPNIRTKYKRLFLNHPDQRKEKTDC